MFTFTVLLILALIVGSVALEPRWRFRLEKPFAIYATVFAAYILVPTLVWSKLDQPADAEKWAVLGASLLALFGVWAGAWVAGGIHPRTLQPPGESPLSLNAAAIVSALLVIAPIVHYAVLASRGLINTHTESRLPSASLFDSFALVFTTQGKFALIVFGGLIARVCTPQRSQQILRWLAVYVVLLVALLTVTSETRPAATAIICGLLAWTAAGNRTVPLKALVGGLSVILVIAVVIQEVRRSDLDEIRNSDAPLSAAASSVWSGMLRTADLGANQQSVESATERMLDGPKFTAVLLNEFGGRAAYLNGQAFIYSLTTMVPRLIMRDKDVVLPLDVYLERELGLEQTDRCLTSVSYFYAEGGWAGILIGHFIVGLILTSVTQRALRSPSMICFLGCSFMWEVALQMELELPMESLSALRLIVFYGALAWLVKALCPQRSVASSHVRRHPLPAFGTSARRALLGPGGTMCPGSGRE